jgi:hypothetical protein
MGLEGETSVDKVISALFFSSSLTDDDTGWSVMSFGLYTRCLKYFSFCFPSFYLFLSSFLQALTGCR